jgi:hypothetical protein
MKYQIRTRHYGDVTAWEELPVTQIELPQTDAEASQLCQAIIRVDPTVREVRFNRDGSLQGHYVGDSRANQ